MEEQGSGQDTKRFWRRKELLAVDREAEKEKRVWYHCSHWYALPATHGVVLLACPHSACQTTTAPEGGEPTNKCED